MKKQVTIIGAGLSGVYAGFLLEKYGITDYVILEAKDSIGGRIVDYPVIVEAQDGEDKIVLPLEKLLVLPYYPAPRSQTELNNIDEFDRWAGGF